MRYDAHCDNCGTVEIEKPMAAEFPLQHVCGGAMRQVYRPAHVIFAAPGFYSTDVNYLKRQISPERYARFEQQRDATLARYASGRITTEDRQAELD